MWMLLIEIIYSMKENFLLKNLLYIHLIIQIKIKISAKNNNKRKFNS